MSSNKNNNNPVISLDNYEEFFILYMDNELTDGQMKMVDAFLLAHPHLQSEFDLLMGTRLPVEAFSFDKSRLLSGSMKMDSIDEDLLLYIDNELPAGKKDIIELELASNKDYYFQHQLLLKTKLDGAEKISYPNKEELYHRRNRLVAFKPWMRIAAVLLLMAGATGLYLATKKPSLPDNTVAVQPEVHKQQVKKPEQAPANITGSEIANVGEPKNITIGTEKKSVDKKKRSNESNVIPDEQLAVHKDARLPDIAFVPTPLDNADPNTASSRVKVNTVANNEEASIESINNLAVTSHLSSRITNTTATSDENPGADDVATRKGSLKGFLRKASKLIEKKTGIDPVNDDGELLIGMVAVKLK